MTWSLGHVQSVLLAEISSQMPEKTNKQTNNVYQIDYNIIIILNGKT